MWRDAKGAAYIFYKLLQMIRRHNKHYSKYSFKELGCENINRSWVYVRPTKRTHKSNYDVGSLQLSGKH